jgi:acyl-CoA thioester hydrolase
MSARPPPGRRSDYVIFHPITTRWHDNDAYGHVNNVIYYAWFDTAVNAWAIREGLLDVMESPVVAIVAETGCRYYRSIAFPERVSVGMRVSRIGRSSVTYALGVFREEEDEAAAEGHFVHVYVARATMRPVPLPERVRSALAALRKEE